MSKRNEAKPSGSILPMFFFLQKEEDNGSTRILFFVNRTGRLQLNTPLFPSVKYQHPLDRSQQRTSPSAILKEDSTEKAAEKKDEELPRKKNTAEFLGLKTDASKPCTC